jgi:hypothetical protein
LFGIAVALFLLQAGAVGYLGTPESEQVVSSLEQQLLAHQLGQIYGWVAALIQKLACRRLADSVMVQELMALRYSTVEPDPCY